MNGNRLYRSRDDRVLAGVAGGLAELWDADPSLIRVVWSVLVIFTGGLALVVYVVMAFVVPEEDGDRPWATPPTGWGSGAATPSASASAVPGSAPRAAAAAPALASTPAPAGSQPFADPGAGGWPTSNAEARRIRHDARAEARSARRGALGREGRSGAVIVGILLIIVGAWSLVRQFLPAIDWDWFWPLVVVGLGVVILVMAVRPAADDRPTGGPPRSDGDA